MRKNNEIFTEIINQNLIEVKFNIDNINPKKMTTNKAITELKNNNKILKNLISKNEIKIKNEELKNINFNDINVDQDYKTIYRETIKKLIQDNLEFNKKLKNIKIDLEKDLNEFKNVLPHPYLIESSPFYKNKTDLKILEIKNIKKEDLPFNPESELPQLIGL